MEQITKISWQDELKNSISSINQLKKYIPLPENQEKQLKSITEIHPIRITHYYLSLINKDDPNDPIKKMIIPSLQELNQTGSYDTGAEKKNTKMPGLQHMYPQTALILATNRCSAYCRYCFRKRLVGLPTNEILHRINTATTYIKKHQEINNVLITGGDPFILPTKIIKNLLDKLFSIQHLDFIRFGTRTPVTFPNRILKDKEIAHLLKVNSLKKQKIYITTQFNHPREITKKAEEAATSLIKSNAILNNQTVLLKGVNDNSEILANLKTKLVNTGINPYYIFQCRPVKRIKNNFQVPLWQGYKIIEKAKKKLDGLSKRFRYVISHKTGKIEIIGVKDNRLCLKYHQAKNPKNLGKIFFQRINKTAGWLDDL